VISEPGSVEVLISISLSCSSSTTTGSGSGSLDCDDDSIVERERERERERVSEVGNWSFEICFVLFVVYAVCQSLIAVAQSDWLVGCV
jgi:hypothetical protein